MIEGQQITPTLRLSRLLGQGAMGCVWIADHLALGTQVAVKFMSPAVAQNASLVQRFHREAMAAAQIKSPHVAQVFDHGMTSEGMPYIVMELLEGEDLDVRVRQRGRMSPYESANVIRQVAKALSRAHQLGIVHRDIKPANIFLLDLDGELLAKVLDFGVAKFGIDANAVGMTSTGAMMGTPLYMSPEQLFSSKHTDARSDLWSLGVVAYFAMTGRVPFHADTLGALSVKVHEGVYPPPSSIQSDISPAVDAWFKQALQRHPDKRFATAREMAQALERAVGMTGNPSLPESVISSALLQASPAVAPSSSRARIEENRSVDESNSQSAKVTRTLSGMASTRSGTPNRRALVALVATLLGATAISGIFFGVSRKRLDESPRPDTERTALGAPDMAPISSASIATVPETTGMTAPAVSAPSRPTSTASTTPSTSVAPLITSVPAAPAAVVAPKKKLSPAKSASATSTPSGVKDTIGF